MKEYNRRIDESKGVTDNAITEMKNIAENINVITEIANQTNILALNTVV